MQTYADQVVLRERALLLITQILNGVDLLNKPPDLVRAADYIDLREKEIRRWGITWDGTYAGEVRLRESILRDVNAAANGLPATSDFVARAATHVIIWEIP